MYPSTIEEARSLLAKLCAPARLIRHVELVGEAAEEIIEELVRLEVGVDFDLIRVGVVLHDAGKILHPTELESPGAKHEPDGEALLLSNGVTPRLARICRSHAQWDAMEVQLEDLLVALSDKLWKGVRKRKLEERVISELADRLGIDRWDLFISLDHRFEQIASEGDERLARSSMLT